MNIYILIALMLTNLLNAAADQTPKAHKAIPNLAEHCAGFIAQQCTSSCERRRNRLHDDPEQQLEHAQDYYCTLITQLHRIEQELTPHNSASDLEQFERACRVIVQALFQSSAEGKKEALGHIDACLFRIVARIKLMQDPFWNGILQELETKKRAATPPSCSIDELDLHLQTDETKKDRLIKQLLKHLEEKPALPLEASSADLEELKADLTPLRKKPEELIELLTKFNVTTQAKRTKDKKKATALYNGAVTSEIHANIQFMHLQDKHEYPQLEQAFGTVALLYLQAHDHGHAKGLEEAEKIMRSRVIDTIIKWKERHHIKEPYAYTSNIWMEINKRKYAHADPATPATSGT